MLIKLLSLLRLHHFIIIYLIICHCANANPWVRDKYFLSNIIALNHTSTISDLQQNTQKLAKLLNEKQQIINSPLLTTIVKQRRLQNIEQELNKEYKKRDTIQSVSSESFKIANLIEYGIGNLTIGLYNSYTSGKYIFNMNKKQFYLAGFAKIPLIKKNK